MPKPKIRYPFEGKYPITFRFGASPEWYVRVFGYPHNGVDFGLPRNTPVLACDDGVVSYADSVPGTDGMGLIVKHKWGTSLYWHLDKLSVKEGKVVSKGEKIGLSGDSGFATGPHLHFGVKVTSIPNHKMRGWTCPIDYIEEEEDMPEEPESEPRKYQVVRGDNLWNIAKKFYGSGFSWRKIYEMNKDKIKDPALIFPGQELIIP